MTRVPVHSKCSLSGCLLCLHLMRFKVSADCVAKSGSSPCRHRVALCHQRPFLLHRLPAVSPAGSQKLPWDFQVSVSDYQARLGSWDTNPSIHLTDNGKTGLSFVPSWNAKVRSAQRIE